MGDQKGGETPNFYGRGVGSTQEKEKVACQGDTSGSGWGGQRPIPKEKSNGETTEGMTVGARKSQEEKETLTSRKQKKRIHQHLGHRCRGIWKGGGRTRLKKSCA